MIQSRFAATWFWFDFQFDSECAMELQKQKKEKKKRKEKKKQKCCDLIRSRLAVTWFRYTMNLQKKKIVIKRCCKEKLDSITNGTFVSVSLFVQVTVLQSVICYVRKPLYVSFVTPASLSLSLSLFLYLIISFSLLFAANHILWIMHFVKKRKDGAKKKERRS